MMTNERSKSARDNFSEFTYQLQSRTKTLVRKLERIQIKLYRQNVSLSFNQTYFWVVVKSATAVEGDPKAPFSIATTPKCRRGRYSFPWITSLYSWYVPYNAEYYARTHQVLFFFLSLYDSTWDWTPVSRIIGEYSTHLTNGCTEIDTSWHR